MKKLPSLLFNILVCSDASFSRSVTETVSGQIRCTENKKNIAFIAVFRHNIRNIGIVEFKHF